MRTQLMNDGDHFVHGVTYLVHMCWKLKTDGEDFAHELD